MTKKTHENMMNGVPVPHHAETREVGHVAGNSTPAHGYSQERIDQARMLMMLPAPIRHQIASMLTREIRYSGQDFDIRQNLAYLLTEYDRSRSR